MLVVQQWTGPAHDLCVAVSSPCLQHVRVTAQQHATHIYMVYARCARCVCVALRATIARTARTASARAAEEHAYICVGCCAVM